MSQPGTDFRPDYAQESAGTYLQWILDSKSIKKIELAKRCGRPSKTISEIISGKASITPDTALQLERVLGVSAKLWLRLEAQHQLQSAKDREAYASRDDHAKLWSRCFPTAAMKRCGFISEPNEDENLVDYLLRYFRVSSVSAWQRFWQDRMDLTRLKQNKHHGIDSYGVSAWLNQGERLAAAIATAHYDESQFRGQLGSLRSLTCRPWKDSEQELVDRCKEVGVAVILLPYLEKSGLRGAAFWATKDKAVILLSDFRKDQASVWFSFFHEAAHILLHSKKMIFVDSEKDGSAEAEIEFEADSFSAEHLVPSGVLKELLTQHDGRITADWIASAAEEIGIGSDLLLARLQHEERLKPNSTINRKFRRKLEFAKCTPFR